MERARRRHRRHRTVHGAGWRTILESIILETGGMKNGLGMIFLVVLSHGGAFPALFIVYGIKEMHWHPPLTMKLDQMTSTRRVTQHVLGGLQTANFLYELKTHAGNSIAICFHKVQTHSKSLLNLHICLSGRRLRGALTVKSQDRSHMLT